MMSFLVISSLCLSSLLLFYIFVFENEKINQFKRLFLWFCIAFSMTIPFVNINLNTAALPINTKEIFLETLTLNLTIKSTRVENSDIFFALYIVGFTVMLFRFAKNLYDIYTTTKRNKNFKSDSVTIILLQENCLPHTFLNYIFLHEKSFLNGEIPHEILQHEKTHAQQWHSVDIIMIEIIKTIFWFNPIFHAYKKAMQRNHEFLADEQVVKEKCNIGEYQTQLLNYISTEQRYLLTSNINYSLTKKRFIMMTTIVSNQKIYIKISKLVLLLLCLTSAFGTTAIAQKKPTTELQVEATAEPDVKPDYPGGMVNFYRYVMNNLNSSEMKPSDKKFRASFIVEKDGTLTNITIVTPTGNNKLDNSLITLLKNSPKWKPGQLKGDPIRVQYFLPINIVSGP